MGVPAEAAFPRPELARSILVNLCRDLPLRHADEDEIDAMLDRLSADHDCDAAVRAPLPAALASMAEGALPVPEDRAALRALAQSERRHMLIENAIVLPQARAADGRGSGGAAGRHGRAAGPAAHGRRSLPQEAACRRYHPGKELRMTSLPVLERPEPLRCGCDGAATEGLLPVDAALDRALTLALP